MKRLFPCEGCAVLTPRGDVLQAYRCADDATSCTCAADAIAYAVELETHRETDARLRLTVERLLDGAMLTAERVYTERPKHVALEPMGSRAKLGNLASNRAQRARRRAA